MVLVSLGQPVGRRRCCWSLFRWGGQWIDGGIVSACFIGAANASTAVWLVLVLLGWPVSQRRCCWSLLRWGGQRNGGGLLLFAKGRFLPVVRTITKFLLHILFLETKSNEALNRFLQYQKKTQIYYEGPSDVLCSLSTFNFILQIQ